MILLNAQAAFLKINFIPTYIPIIKFKLRGFIIVSKCYKFLWNMTKCCETKQWELYRKFWELMHENNCIILSIPKKYLVPLL